MPKYLEVPKKKKTINKGFEAENSNIRQIPAKSKIQEGNKKSAFQTNK